MVSDLYRNDRGDRHGVCVLHGERGRAVRDGSVRGGVRPGAVDGDRVSRQHVGNHGAQFLADRSAGPAHYVYCRIERIFDRMFH